MYAIKRLVKFATALLMCFCSSSSQMVCKTTFNSSVALPLARVYGTFPAWCPRRDSTVGSYLESLRPLILLNKPATIRLQPVLLDARTLRSGAIVYTPHNLANFTYISTKLGTWWYSVYFLV